MATTHEPSSFLSSAPPPTDSLLLRDLAQRIRALRKARSLTRKNPSQLADVSERHLAQLESGEGNISILLLNRIASALNTSLAELFTSQSQSSATETSPRLKRIALIEFHMDGHIIAAHRVVRMNMDIRIRHLAKITGPARMVEDHLLV